MIKFIFNKRFVLIFAALAALLFFGKIVLAVWDGLPYDQGETLDPECLPTQVDCDVNVVSTTITVADTTDTTSFVGLFESATGNLGPKTDAGLTYNAGTGLLTATGFSGPLTGNVTGNVSGTAATVTGAAQAAITSLGTLTTLTVDDITINGNTISSAGASTLAITPTAGQAITFDGTVTLDAGVIAGATSITSTTFVGALTGNADTVTTNANLTGPITSVGNATAVAAQTGTGTTFVMNTSPTLVTPVLGVATGTSLDLGTTTLLASRALTIDTGGVFDINLGTAAGDDFTIDTSAFVVEGDTGNVGIGTASPGTSDTTVSKLLAVHSTDADKAAEIAVSNSDKSKYIYLWSGRTSDPDPGISYPSTQALRFGTAGTDYTSPVWSEKMRLSSSGNLGISTTAPQSLLDVQGPVGTGATGAGILTLATKELTIVDGDELGRINFNAPLESDGTDAILAGAAIWAEADDTFSATVNSTELVFGTATTSAAVERMRIDSAGNVGIGTATPSNPLTVHSVAVSGGQLRLNSPTTNDEVSLGFSDSSDTSTQRWVIGKNIGVTDDSFSFYYNGTQVSISTAGAITAGTWNAGAVTSSGVITAATGFMPDANDGAYLGQSGTAFSDLFLASGGVINWNAGDVTLTHSTDLVTIAGGGLALTGLVGIDYNPGSDADTDIATIGVTGAPRLFWDESQDSFSSNKGWEYSATIKPVSSDGAALGTSSLMWSDLFLASGSVINWNNGDMTLTHAADTLTIAGGAVDIQGATTLGSGTEAARITTAGILKVGGTASRATTEGDKRIDIFDGTAPVGTLANGISIYSSSGEGFMMDAGGTGTQQTPHDDERFWIFNSFNGVDDTSLVIEVEKILRFTNDYFGLDYIEGYMAKTELEQPILETFPALADLHLSLEGIAGISVPEEDSPAESFVSAFFDNLFVKISEWLADAGNGIASIFTQEIHTELICVGDTCLTEAELQALISNSGTTGATYNPTPTLPEGEGDTEPLPSEEVGGGEPEVVEEDIVEEPTPDLTPTLPEGEGEIEPLPSEEVGGGESEPTPEPAV